MPGSAPAGSAAHHSAPIGVFDSGIGGLTVVAELRRQLPSESILYFGDTARLPYGPKSPETVLRYSREIAALLLERGVKAIVVACNTATAHALAALQSELTVPVVGVIEPGARAATRGRSGGVVGVIGTRGTIASGAYTRSIAAQDPNVRVVGVACPLFVPLVEEGWTEDDATDIITRRYLAPLIEERATTVVLGCTHYPLLKPMLQRILGDAVRLIDSAEETAAEVKRVLSDRGLLAGSEQRPVHHFMASDAPDQFREVGQRFLGLPVDRVEVVVPL